METIAATSPNLPQPSNTLKGRLKIPIAYNSSKAFLTRVSPSIIRNQKFKIAAGAEIAIESQATTELDRVQTFDNL